MLAHGGGRHEGTREHGGCSGQHDIVHWVSEHVFVSLVVSLYLVPASNSHMYALNEVRASVEEDS